MLDKYILHSIDKALNDIMDMDADMSGKIIVFVRD